MKAEYKVSFKETMGEEGGLNFNPDDKGNVVVKGITTVPTYRGVAPKFWGNWRGFTIIKNHIAKLVPMPRYGTEEFKKWRTYLNQVLAADTALQGCVESFYEVNFWDANMLRDLVNQLVANWLFDHIVNGGGRGVKWMQEAAGVTVDGDIGPKTIAAINAHDPDLLLQEAELVAEFYRLDKALLDPSQIQFLPSWFRRDGASEAEIKQVMQAAKDGLTYTEVKALKEMLEGTA